MKNAAPRPGHDQPNTPPPPLPPRRSAPTLDPTARAAVQATDQRRLSYVQRLFERSGVPPGVARSRAQIFYWAFVGFTQSDKPLPKPRQDAVLEELLRMALR